MFVVTHRAGSWSVERAEHMHQRTLACTGRTDDRNDFTRVIVRSMPRKTCKTPVPRQGYSFFRRWVEIISGISVRFWETLNISFFSFAFRLPQFAFFLRVAPHPGLGFAQSCPFHAGRVERYCVKFFIAN